MRSLRTGLTIGAPQDVIAAATVLGAREICNVYGQTESYGNCCVTPHDWPLERRAACQGPPLPGVEIRIVDADTGAELPRGEEGMIEVRGYVTRGYIGDSASQTADAITPDGFFRTGDMGRLLPDGTMSFSGRVTEMIKKSGINISPAEVEDVLMRHATVALAGVVGVPDATQGELLAAFVVAKPGTDAHGPRNLTAHCRALASRYKVPDFIEIRDALPVTVTGKLMRRELKQIAASLGPRRRIVTREAWHRWGDEDERGALNHIGAAQVRDAAALVRSGQVLSLAQPLSPRTPVPQHRAGMQHFMGRDGGDYAAGARQARRFSVRRGHRGAAVAYRHAHRCAVPRLVRRCAVQRLSRQRHAQHHVARRVAGSTRWGRSLGAACCSTLPRCVAAPLADGAAIGARRSGARCERRPTSKVGKGDIVLIRTGWAEQPRPRGQRFIRRRARPRRRGGALAWPNARSPCWAPTTLLSR